MLMIFLLSPYKLIRLEQTFQMFSKYKMRLNSAKCAFSVASRKFMGFMVHNQGIEAIPEKIPALLEMKSPAKVKDVQCLTRCIAALNRFIACATDKSRPFFNALKKGQSLLGQMIVSAPFRS